MGKGWERREHLLPDQTWGQGSVQLFYINCGVGEVGMGFQLCLWTVELEFDKGVGWKVVLKGTTVAL